LLFGVVYKKQGILLSGNGLPHNIFSRDFWLWRNEGGRREEANRKIGPTHLSYLLLTASLKWFAKILVFYLGGIGETLYHHPPPTTTRIPGKPPLLLTP
jgi:hypothetical protein